MHHVARRKAARGRCDGTERETRGAERREGWEKTGGEERERERERERRKELASSNFFPSLDIEAPLYLARHPRTSSSARTENSRFSTFSYEKSSREDFLLIDVEAAER